MARGRVGRCPQRFQAPGPAASRPIQHTRNPHTLSCSTLPASWSTISSPPGAAGPSMRDTCGGEAGMRCDRRRGARQAGRHWSRCARHCLIRQLRRPALWVVVHENAAMHLRHHAAKAVLEAHQLVQPLFQRGGELQGRTGCDRRHQQQRQHSPAFLAACLPDQTPLQQGTCIRRSVCPVGAVSNTMQL